MLIYEHFAVTSMATVRIVPAPSIHRTVQWVNGLGFDLCKWKKYYVVIVQSSRAVVVVQG